MIKWIKCWLSDPERRFLPVRTTDFIEERTPELIDFWGNPVDSADRRILAHQGKRWFLKYKNLPESLYRDRLAYLLGHQWVNVAEVLPLNRWQFAQVRRRFGPLAKWSSTLNTYLVRLAQDYKTDELSHQDLEGAVASELVFSMWIRRRDAHAANRAYVNGVPIFFDHETAFLGEPELSDVDVFFLDGIDAGSAGNWRVIADDGVSCVTTHVMRQLGIMRKRAIHVVKDMESFEKSLDHAVSHILCQNPDDWYVAAREAGYESCRAREIAGFLLQNSLMLEDSLQKMREVIFRG